MTHRFSVPTLLLASLFAACGGSRCPEGTFRSGGRCEPVRTDGGPVPRVDAGTHDAGTMDASFDAGVDAATGDRDAATEDAGEGGVDGGVDGGPDAGPCGACPATQPICDEAAMRCVECTAVDDGACGDEGCEVAAGVCRVPLCEPCTSDAQCGAGRACVMEEDGDSPRCVWREDAAAGPMGSCLEHGRPFVELLETISVDGAPVRACVIGPSTCEAWLVFRSPMACTTDADCGAGGSCIDGDPGSATVLRCTMACVTDIDCPVGVTCDRAAGLCALAR